MFSPELHPENGFGLGTPETSSKLIERYAELGVNHVILFPACPPERVMSEYEALARTVIPHFRS